MPHRQASVTLVLGLSLVAGLALQEAHASAFRLLLETDADTDNNEVFITSFATFDDLVNSPPSGGIGAFSGININSAYSVGGLAYDGMYHLLLETDADTDNNEVFITSFATFDDLVNSPPS